MNHLERLKNGAERFTDPESHSRRGAGATKAAVPRLMRPPHAPSVRSSLASSLVVALVVLGASSGLAAQLGVGSDIQAVSVVGSGQLADADGDNDDGDLHDGDGRTLRVGHQLIHVALTGSMGEARSLPVDVWYPARNRGFEDAPVTVYRSGLFGVPLTPQWDPLFWSLTFQVAREGAALRRGEEPYPVIIFSHGSNAEALRSVKMLEELAAAGFVVAAPKHVGNSQDDVRADFINTTAGRQVLSCEDGLTSPCAHPSVPVSMRNRALDVEAVVQAVGALFGARVDIDRIGILGHSRGTTTALALAGGSAAWNIPVNPRVKVIMGLAIAPPDQVSAIDLGQIQIPTVLMAGGNDQNTPAFISEAAIAAIPAPDKLLIELAPAVHRHFTASQCSVMQASGTVAMGNVRAILDRHTFDLIAVNPINGSSLDYCAFSYFVDPNDVRPLVFADTGVGVTPTNVPRTGLTSDAVDQQVVEVATALFGTVLTNDGSSGDHSTRFLAPELPGVSRGKRHFGQGLGER